MAPNKCCVGGCDSTSNTHKLFCMPMNDNLRNLWLSFLVPTNPYLLGMTKNQLTTKRVCEKHFDSTQFDQAGVRIRYSYPCLFTDLEIAHGVPLAKGCNFLDEHNYCQSREQNDNNSTGDPITMTGDISQEHPYSVPSTSQSEVSLHLQNEVSQTAEANVPEVLSEQKENKYVQASCALPSTTPPSPNQVVNDADPSVAEEDDDGDDSDTLVESNVVNDADPSVAEEDDDGDDSGTLVESNMCRVCLALDVKMYDLRDNELKTMFQNITGIMFNENNYSVLGSLCWECAARLKAAATFRSKALLSDSLLQDLVASGEQIRKNDITALKENALSQGHISDKTLTVIDVFHIVDIEDQNNTTQFLQSTDDGDQTSSSERFIVKEIEECFEMDVDEDENIAIEIDPFSPKTEEAYRTKIDEKRPVHITSSSEDNTVKSDKYSLLRDMGITDKRISQENFENYINKTEGIKKGTPEIQLIEDDNIVTIKTEIEDDPSSPDNEERNTEGENPLISSSSQDNINSDYSSLLLDMGQFLVPSDILRSSQEDSDTE